MKEAMFYDTIENNDVVCNLCPHHCRISPGKYGICKVRKNLDGQLFLMNYNLLTALNLDPIEKKPLYHFKPGSNILSIGNNGCNLACTCCQNWEIAQTSVEDYPNHKKINSDEILKRALQHDNVGIAFTYNEPTVWYEFMFEIAQKSKQHGLSNVMVSNGFINPTPLGQLLPFMDAFNIDLKGFTNQFYRKITKSTLQPVLESLVQIKKAGKHLEITNLLIPDENDDIGTFTEMIKWIKENLGADQVLHISRYFPNYKMQNPVTETEKMIQFYNIAREYLSYVYLGNIHVDKAQDTRCIKCGTGLIWRSGYTVQTDGLDMEGRCGTCGHQVVSY